MKFDDPFGRKAQKQERDYASLSEALRKAGVTTAADVQRCERNITRNAVIMVVLSLLSVLLAALVYPAVLGIVTVLAAIVLLWIAASTVSGRRHLQRYRREEVDGKVGKVRDGEVPDGEAHDGNSKTEEKGA